MYSQIVVSVSFPIIRPAFGKKMVLDVSRLFTSNPFFEEFQVQTQFIMSH